METQKKEACRKRRGKEVTFEFKLSDTVQKSV
jgi:hypothetical protein